MKKESIGSLCKGAVVAAALMLLGLPRLAVAATVHPSDLGAVMAKSGDTLQLGQWYLNFTVVKKYAEDNDIPLFAVWSNKDCSHCYAFDILLLRDSFKTFQKTENAGKVLYCFMGGKEPGMPDQAGSAAYNWMWHNKSLTQYPFIACYWKGKVEYHQTGDRFRELKTGEEGVNRIIANMRKYFAGWEPNVPEVDQWDPKDDTDTGATAITVSKTAVSQGPHHLNATDTADYFRLTMDPAQTNIVWLSALQATDATNVEITTVVGETEKTVAFSEEKLQFFGVSNVLLRVSRDPGTNAVVRYTLNAKQYVPQAIGFAAAQQSFEEKAQTVTVEVTCEGDAAEANVTGKLKFINGTATLGTHYKLPTATQKLVDDGFTWKPKSVNRVSIQILTDRKWNESQDFQIQIVPDDGTVNLLPYGTMTVRLTEATAPRYGNIGFYSYTDPETGRTMRYSSSKKIAVREGDTIENVAATRVSGVNGKMTVDAVWSADKSVMGSYVWENGQQGESSPLALTIPVTPNYQTPQELTVELEATTNIATVASLKKYLKLMVYDQTYSQSLADYARAVKPSITFKTSDDAWFIATEEDTVYRSGLSQASMTASLRGPGVLTFKAGMDTAGLAVTVGRNAAVECAEGVCSYVIPSGSQTVEIEYEGAGQAQISEVAFIALSDAAAPVAPVTGEILPMKKAVRFSWNSASITALPGLTVSNYFCMGEQAINCGTNAFIDLKPATAGRASWWTEVEVADTYGQAVRLASKKQNITVASEGVASFAGEVYGLNAFPAEQSTQGENYSGTVFDLMVGMKTKLGPVTLAEGADGLKKLKGSLPSGLKIESETNGVFITGVPSRAVTNSCILQALSGRAAGTTLPVLFRVAPLPGYAVGTFTGMAMMSNRVGVATLTVTAAGKITGLATLGGKRYSFKPTGFDSYEPEGSIFSVSDAFTAGSGRTKSEIAVSLTLVGPDPAVGVPKQGVVTAQGAETGFVLSLTRNGWRDRDLSEPLAKQLALTAGKYYTFAFQSEEKPGYMTLTMSKTGTGRAAVKMADGTSFSLSGTLMSSLGQSSPVLLIPLVGTKGGLDLMAEVYFAEDGACENSQVGLYDGTQKTTIPLQGGFYAKTSSLYDLYAVDKAEITNAGFLFNASPMGESGVVLNFLSTGRGVEVGDNDLYDLSMRVTLGSGIFTGSLSLTPGDRTSKMTFAGVLTPAAVSLFAGEESLIGEGLAGGGFMTDVSKKGYALELLPKGECGQCGP